MKEIIILGEPIAMMRPRVARGRAYNPQAKMKQRCQFAIRPFWKEPPLSGPVFLGINFFVRRDNKDIDNCIKWILDILQGIVFKNDLQVKHIWATKVKGNREPKTVIYVSGEDSLLTGDIRWTKTRQSA